MSMGTMDKPKYRQKIREGRFQEGKAGHPCAQQLYSL